MADHPPPECTPFPPPTEDGSDPLAFDPAWGTEAVRGLARSISEDDAFDLLPILADALEDAGCDNRTLLDHCRLCPAHDPDCWAVRFVLFACEAPPPPPEAAAGPAAAQPIHSLPAGAGGSGSGMSGVGILLILGAWALLHALSRLPDRMPAPAPAPPAVPPEPSAPPRTAVPVDTRPPVPPPTEDDIRRLADEYRRRGMTAEAKQLDGILQATREARARQGAAVTGAP